MSGNHATHFFLIGMIDMGNLKNYSRRFNLLKFILASAMVCAGLIATSDTVCAECVSAVAGGGNHTIYLKTDGTVWACGKNNHGQLGDGTTTERHISVKVTGLTGVRAIAAGESFTVVLKSDGTVWTWGWNVYGQLGDDTTTERHTPIQVSGLTGVEAISAGAYYAIALKTDGTVWVWGHNDYGQLGDGTTTDRYTPVQVSGLTDVKSIAGGYHTIVLKTDGTVWAWGWNVYGQLGDGTTTNRTTPVQVSGLTGVTDVSAGYTYSVVLKRDGTVWSWGYNVWGQLGDGTTTERHTPVQVSGLTGVSAIATGPAYYNRTIVLKADGTVWAWGGGGYGMIGDGTTEIRLSPVQVSGLTGISIVASGVYHGIALKSDGTVCTWGYNGYGELGDGTTTDRYTPVQVSGLTCEDVTGCITAVAGRSYFSFALKTDATVWAWGGNWYGQLGDGTTTQRYSPVQVSGLTGVKAITAGGNHTLALKPDGTVWAWGYNYFGQLGDGTTTNRYIPVQASGLTGVKTIAGGGNHTLALKTDGTVWAWGYNVYGQLGDGTTANRYTPVQISGLTGVIAIACGSSHSIALKTDGTVWAWGNNWNGQLGDGTSAVVAVTTPIQASGLTGVTAIVGESAHSIALKSDGTVWAWGSNSNGVLGDGTTTNRSTPVQVSGLTGVNVIATGGLHTVALKTDGTVWAWGGNYSGQLGDGTTTHRYTPVQVSGLTEVNAIIGGGSHTIALKTDGTVWAWGSNSNGQLGDDTGIGKTTPVQVAGIICYTDTTPPNPPQNITGAGSNTIVSLDWADNAETDMAGYNIYRAISSGGPYTKLNASILSSSQYQDTGLTNGTTYCYVVTAVDTASNESDYSNEVCVTPADNVASSPPTGLTATAGNQTISLDWNNNTESDLAGYNVYRSTTSGSGYSKINTSPVTVSQYADSGLTNGTTYYYVITAIDTANNESGYSSQISATPMSNPPTASASATPESGTAPLTVNFTGTGTDDGSITKYEWDFDGNGTYDWSSTTGGNTTKTYSTAGTYQATLRVTDNDGLTGTASVTITVSSPPQPPVGSLLATPTSGTAPLTVTFTYSGTDTDGSITKYEIDFDGNGVYDYTSVSAGSTSHTYGEAGTYTARLKITDNDGLTATALVIITVSSPPEKIPPTGSLSATPTSGTAPLTVTFTYSGTDSDGTIQKYEIDYDGNGTYDFTSTNSGSTSYTYGQAGSYTAILRVTDNDGLTATASVTITVSSSPEKIPPTGSLSATPTSGTAPLTVTFTYSGTDSDGTIQKYEIDYDGNGTYDFTSTNSGSTSYTYGQAGSYTAILRVTDNDGLTRTSSIIITVTSPPLPPTGSLSATPTSGTAPLSVTFIYSGTDTDGSIQKYEIDFDGNGTYDFVSTSSGNTSYTYGQGGNYTATLKVTDNDGLSGTATVTISVDESTGTNPLIADANCNPSSVTVGETVVLTGTAMGGSGNYIVYIWDYEGDGEYDWASTTTGTTSHIYDSPGSYSPTVMVIDSNGLTDTDSAALTVSSPPTLKIWISVLKDGNKIWGTDVTLHANTAPGNLTKSVQFQYSGGTTDWANIGSEMFPPPYSFFATTWDVTGLEEGDYQLRAVGRDTSDNIVNSETVTVIVNQNDPDIEDGKDPEGNRKKKEKISKDETTEVKIDDDTTVEIPYGSLAVDDTLTITEYETNPVNTIKGASSSLDNFRRIELEGDPTLQKSVTVTIPYDDADNDGIVDGTGIPEEDLKLWWYNPDEGKWENIPDIEIDTTDKKVKGKVGHLSDFAIGACYALGDINNDGDITSRDALLVFKIYLGFVEPSECEQAAADMNQDGEITSRDALRVFKAILGL